jgi:hypothetical protein
MLVPDVSQQQLLRALAALADERGADDALRALARRAAASNFNSAAVLLKTNLLIRPEQFDAALKAIVRHCPDRKLENVTDEALIAAQRDDQLTIEAMCLLAGLTYTDLRARIDGLPPDSGARWEPTQVRAAFKEIDRVVRRSVSVGLSGAVGVGPIEVIIHDLDGDAAWELLGRQQRNGVSLGTLLAQRAAGGTWLAHRNRTSSQITAPLADTLCGLLDDRGVAYRRSAAIGGDTPATELQKLTNCDKTVTLAAIDETDQAVFGVIFTAANDGGTANANAGKLRGMRRDPALPIAIVAIGPGWAQRTETGDLASAFDGRLYTDRTIADLSDEIRQIATTTTNRTAPFP